jgi:hypothetical protein
MYYTHDFLFTKEAFPNLFSKIFWMECDGLVGSLYLSAMSGANVTQASFVNSSEFQVALSMVSLFHTAA